MRWDGTSGSAGIAGSRNAIATYTDRVDSLEIAVVWMTFTAGFSSTRVVPITDNGTTAKTPTLIPIVACAVILLP